ncbi:MAG TPA: hypothetical protein DIV86_01910 [Alphaproteobacteria bacterium]|nr:hypothetical protein [Alphaproteobacteria bacterium]
MANTIGSSFLNNTSSLAEKSAGLFSSNSETYLQLFLTQLKNQDPTQPMEVADMTQQLSQLTNSQQLIETNKNLETLIAMQNNGNASNLASFINKEVEYKGSDFLYDGTNPSELSYILGEGSNKTNIEILDAAGKVIFQADGSLDEGKHGIAWGGVTTTGAQAAAGQYRIRVNALDSEGVYQEQSTLIKGIVSGIDFASSSEPVIRIGKGIDKTTVELSNIASVQNIE